jgi:hypothetical protein
LDAEKATRATLEAEVQRLKANILPEQDRTALTDRVTRAETRAKELEDAIRFVDYEKSTEFNEKYHQPYVDSWQRAMKQIGQLRITDATTGQQRAATADDMVALTMLPLQEAQDKAEELFGKFADRAMAHRDKIIETSELRQKALDDAKTNGAQRETQTKEQRQKQLGEVLKFTRDAFKAISDEILANPKIGPDFSPRLPQEGQQPTREEKQWNDSLAAGFKLVDEGWSKNPTDHRLTVDERKTIIAQHAAIRNRAAGWKPLKLENRWLQKRISELETELKQYSESTPGTRGSVPPANGQRSGGTALERLHAGIEEAARRASR